jgi:DNA invertase Pin-like site-specific DNA recombinase
LWPKGLFNIAGMYLGYAQLAHQEVSPMVAAQLKAAGCELVVIDCNSVRRSLDRAVGRLRRGDVLVVPALDCLASTLPELVHRLHEIDARGVSLRSLADEMDVRSDSGSQLVGALMAFERSRASERIRFGMSAAKSHGQHVGRPRLLAPQQVRAAMARVHAGEPVPSVAKELGVSRQTLQRAFRGSEALASRGNR